MRFKLPLFAANMEFYLKELIIVCLRSLTLNSHVVSLREVFQRAAFARQRLDAELRAAPNADAVTELLEEGTLHEWHAKRPGTSPRKLLARFPQSREELAL